MNLANRAIPSVLLGTCSRPRIRGADGSVNEEWPREAEKLPGLLRVVLGLRDGVGTIEEKSDDLFEGLLADVHGAVDAIGRLDPIHFADRNVPGLRFPAIAELDAEQVAAEDHGYAMKRVAMPRRGFAGRQPLPANENVSTMVQGLLSFCKFHT